VPVSDSDLAFLQDNRSAAMITVGTGGVPKVARVGAAVVDGKVWSSGTRTRLRTRRMRNDPRCTLYVHDGGFAWVALETRVTILDGPEAPEQNLRLMRLMQGKPTGDLSWFGSELTEQQFLEKMIEEERLVYEFEIQHSYGLH
jgi:uncharacterized pyridoxamine 5'-phosphate oxidase family protein